MRYSIPVKFIAVLLTAVALVAAFGGILGIAQVAELGLYTDGFDRWVDNRLQWQAYDLAKKLTERYAVRALTNCSDELLEELGYFYVFTESVHWTGFGESVYDYSIVDGKGNVLAGQKGIRENVPTYEHQAVITVHYPVEVTIPAVIDEIYGGEYLYKDTKYPEIYENKPVTIRYYESPQYTVTVRMDAEAAIGRTNSSLKLVQMIYELRYGMMILLAVSLAVCSAGVVYICCAAGKSKPGQEPMPGGLNKLPLDLYGAIAGTAGYFLVTLVVQLMDYWIYKVDNLNPGTLALACVILTGVALLAVGFFYALVAQIKAKDNDWWKRSLTKWLADRLMAGGRAIGAVLPMIWSFLLIGVGMVALLTVAAVVYTQLHSIWLLVVAVTACLAVVIYGGYCYGTILRGAEKMAKGDLQTRIDTRYMVGFYSHCAEHLNALAEVAIAAAQKQLRSERMKTELITNISHDIKTPLTSIINYVDILRAEPDGADRDQYLEVLGRQSQRLKKLIEDLMEMSRASSGSIRAEMAALDPVETLRQALGEFADKLEAKDLTVVFPEEEQMAAIWADGRLTWRVLSNLLSNVVKYALPGTRVYVDVAQPESKVLISIKNISREPLNMTAEELMERFVRGDASRNTEGSGLGLNIAKSLMELQKGQLKLLADGDLFKATLVFSKAADLSE